jgi:hypothetical protein
MDGNEQVGACRHADALQLAHVAALADRRAPGALAFRARPRTLQGQCRLNSPSGMPPAVTPGLPGSNDGGDPRACAWQTPQSALHTRPPRCVYRALRRSAKIRLALLEEGGHRLPGLRRGQAGAELRALFLHGLGQRLRLAVLHQRLGRAQR